MHISYTDLVNMILDGDHAAFRTLMEQYTPAIFRVGEAMVSDLDDVDDIVQQTFINAWRTLAAFDGRAGLETWLTRIALNCGNELRRARDRETWPKLADHRDVESTDPDPERLAFSHELELQIRREVARLPPKERAAFILRYYGEWSIRDIARVLEVDENAARNSIFRAVQKLRVALEPLVSEVQPCI